MKVDRQTMVAHRAAILDQAGRLFRKHGIDAVPVADITGAAGLTHGAFYGHFPSKAALAAESCRHSLDRSAHYWRERADQARAAGVDPLSALIDSYLTPTHRDSREKSCMLASLGPEASRDPALCPAMTAGVGALIGVLRELIVERRPDTDPRENLQAALAVLAAISGGLSLARALSAEPDLSNAALTSAAELARRAAE